MSEKDHNAELAAVANDTGIPSDRDGKPQFTKGPWKLDAANCGGGINISDARRRRVAHTSCVANIDGKSLNPAHCIETPEATANAHLIAAAPDLYEALKTVAEFLGDGRWEYGDGTPFKTAAVHGALAKAEGRHD